MPRSYPHADQYSTKIQCIADYGIFEREEQLEEDQLADQMSIKEYIDPFTGSKQTKA